MNSNRRRYITVIVTACALSLSVIFLSQYYAYKQATIIIENQFNKQQMSVSKLTALRIEDDIKLLIKELQLLSMKPAVRNIDVQGSRGMFEEVFSRVRSLHVNDVAILDDKGTVRLPLQAPQLTGADFSFREYFRTAATLKDSVPTYEFIEFKGVNSGEKGIVIAMPLFKNSSVFNGVVLFTIKIRELIDGFIPSGEDSNSYQIIDNSGNVLYKSATDEDFNKLCNTNESFRKFFEQSMTSKGYTTRCASPGGNVLVVTSYPLNVADQLCLFVISTPVKSVSGFLNHMALQYAVTTSIIFIALSGISIFIIYLINRWNIALRDEITERRRAEARIADSLKEKEVLLKEIHHRVKNNMAIISSLLQLQSRYGNDENVTRMFRDSQSRISSMALVHEKLYHTKDFANIDFREYVEDLVSHLLSTYEIKEGNISLALSVDDVDLNIDTMIPCGLMLNELVTNSLKYAFGGIDRPQINISFRMHASRAELIYGDNGIGMPEHIDLPNSNTLGLQIVSMLTKQMNGTIKLERDYGTRFTIDFMPAA